MLHLLNHAEPAFPMPPIHRLTLMEQTAEHVRDGLRAGRWKDQLPGVLRLARELGVAAGTLRQALRLLENAGDIALSADGRSRQIRPMPREAGQALRVGILLWEKLEEDNSQAQQLLHGLAQALEKMGCAPFFSGRSQGALRHEVGRIGRYVAKTEADAWVVFAGSRPVLEWFATQRWPCLALAGRFRGLPIAAAAPDKVPAYRELIRRLIALGHRRIVLLAGQGRRLPKPGRMEAAYLEELARHGITGDDYHLPDWEETPAGFQRVLTELFRHSAPTALITDEVRLLTAALQFLAHRKLGVPEQVSVVCGDEDPAFVWCRPTLTHVRWHHEPLIRHAVRWAKAIRRGRVDQQQVLYPAELVVGGTIGVPPPG